MFKVTAEAFFGTTPADSAARALVSEIIISFLLMFVISGVATDSRAVSVPYTYIYIIHISVQMEILMLFWIYLTDRRISWNCGRDDNNIERLCSRVKLTFFILLQRKFIY